MTRRYKRYSGNLTVDILDRFEFIVLTCFNLLFPKINGRKK